MFKSRFMQRDSKQARRGDARHHRARVEGLEPRQLFTGIATHTFSLPDTTNFPENLIVGPDKNIWFSSELSAHVGKITTAGTVKLFDTSSASPKGPSGLTLGPDGNLWFDQEFDRVVAKMTPAGQIKTFKLPDTFDAPTSLVTGPDGNLWFVDFFSKIDKFSTSGSLVRYAHPSHMDKAISFGGEIYFGEGNAIGRITTGGVLNGDFLLPSKGTLVDMTAGPDGNLWFTEKRADLNGPNNFVGYLSAGKIKEFPISKALGDLSGIAAGGNGNLYFRQGDSLVGISTSGKIVATQNLGFIAGGGDMVEGPDGNVWFAEGVLNRIGYASTAGAIAGGGSVTGKVFSDINKNGQLNTGEAGVANVRVYADLNHDGLFDAGDVSTLTDSTGAYKLNLVPGTFTIGTVAPAGKHGTGTLRKTAVVSAGKITSAINFGLA